MKTGVCGINCGKCPRMVQGKCPNGEKGCVPKENKYCRIAACAFGRNAVSCFDCSKFPCEINIETIDKFKKAAVALKEKSDPYYLEIEKFLKNYDLMAVKARQQDRADQN